MIHSIDIYEDGRLVRTETVEVSEAAVNMDTLHEQARQAMTANRAFLAIATPTNAQTLAQVKALTRQNTRIIRLLLNELDGTD